MIVLGYVSLSRRKRLWDGVETMNKISVSVLSLAALLLLSPVLGFSVQANGECPVNEGDWIKYDYFHPGYDVYVHIPMVHPTEIMVEFASVEGGLVTANVTLHMPTRRNMTTQPV